MKKILFSLLAFVLICSVSFIACDKNAMQDDVALTAVDSEDYRGRVSDPGSEEFIAESDETPEVSPDPIQIESRAATPFSIATAEYGEKVATSVCSKYANYSIQYAENSLVTLMGVGFGPNTAGLSPTVTASAKVKGTEYTFPCEVVSWTDTKIEVTPMLPSTGGKFNDSIFTTMSVKFTVSRKDSLTQTAASRFKTKTVSKVVTALNVDDADEPFGTSRYECLLQRRHFGYGVYSGGSFTNIEDLTNYAPHAGDVFKHATANRECVVLESFTDKAGLKKVKVYERNGPDSKGATCKSGVSKKTLVVFEGKFLLNYKNQGWTKVALWNQ